MKIKISKNLEKRSKFVHVQATIAVKIVTSKEGLQNRTQTLLQCKLSIGAGRSGFGCECDKKDSSDIYLFYIVNQKKCKV